MFTGYYIYILPSALGPKRRTLLETQMSKNGADILTELSNDSLTHVVVEENILRDSLKCAMVVRNAGLDVEKRREVKVVGTQWVTKCLKDKSVVDTREYELVRVEVEVVMDKPVAECTIRDATNKNCALDKDEIEADYNICQPSQPKKIRSEVVEKFACSRASGSSGDRPANLLITTELQKLADAFRSSGDHWRSHGYDKAISAIRAYNKEITSFEEAQGLGGVGKKMAAKVAEILDSGRLRKVEEICGQERMQAVELFTKVWGVGPATAEAWYQQGYRSLEDLRQRAALNKQQAVGLKHFDDLQARIPRAEVKQIADLVTVAALALDSSVSCVAAGSYRRGKLTCGDIDVLVAKDSGKSNFLCQLVQQLRATGLITDDLVDMESSGGQRKYLGVCRLPGDNQLHRRLDVFVVARAELAPALMHYTGSALFNRSIRLLALHKGMSLSEHALHGGIVRNGKEAVNSGHVIPTPTEESIFAALGLDYRPPEERDH